MVPRGWVWAGSHIQLPPAPACSEWLFANRRGEIRAGRVEVPWAKSPTVHGAPALCVELCPLFLWWIVLLLQYCCFIVGTACNLLSPSPSSPGLGTGNASVPGWTHRVSPDVTFAQRLLLGGRGRASHIQHQARSGNNKGGNDKIPFKCQWPARPPVGGSSRGPFGSVRGRKSKLRYTGPGVLLLSMSIFPSPPPPPPPTPPPSPRHPALLH